MSILIKGMEMPKRCVDCKLKRDKHLPTACIFRDWQSLTVNDTPQTNEWCPLVEVPPHGDLVDRDEFITFIKNRLNSYYQWIIEMIEECPTVIPADKDGESR